MRVSRIVSMTAGIACLAGIALAQAPQSAGSDDGLEPRRASGLQSLRMRPGVSLAQYRQLVLEPMEVAFSKTWDPRPAGVKVSDRENLQLRERLARVLAKEFRKVLQNDGRYEVVDHPGPDVLSVRVAVEDLYINAPDVSRPGIVRQYTLTTGEMTLNAELRDSVTGELLARIRDRRRDPESNWLELTTALDNDQSVRRAAAKWAEALKALLETARQQPAAEDGRLH
ncbi:MAG: DUF3313 family protein [Steroidobacteraceae bacterium]